MFHFHAAVNLALLHDCQKGCPASSTGSAVNLCPCRFDNLFGHVRQWFGCYLPVKVVSQGIMPIYRSDTCTGFPQHCCIKEMGFAKMMQKWRVV